MVETRMASVDLETTSPDPLEARMVTAAVVFVGGARPVDSFSVLCDPGVEIPIGATEVHGITTARARADGVPAPAAVAMVLEALDRRPPDSAVITMQARFDLTILDREAHRYGLVPLSDRARPLHVVDVRVVDLWLDRFRKGKRTLADLCREYGVRIDRAHDAAADAIAAARVAYWIGTQVDVFRQPRNRTELRDLLALRREWDRVRHDLPALHAAQERWAADQADGLEQYFRRNGRPETVAREWPVITGRLI